MCDGLHTGGVTTRKQHRKCVDYNFSAAVVCIRRMPFVTFYEMMFEVISIDSKGRREN